MDDNTLFLNGVNGATGDYMLPPLDLHQAADLVKGQGVDPKLAKWLKTMWTVMRQSSLGLPFNVDPTSIAQAGWGIVFHVEEDAAIQQALEPLVEHRRKQIGDHSKVKVLTYYPGDERAKWLARSKVAAGSVEPTKVPFYLLLIGSPERIPFLFGHLLSVEYAVGRLHFESPAEYAQYVASLIDYEQSQAVPQTRDVVFFAPRHPFDRATQLSADRLVKPLAGVSADVAEHPQGGIADSFKFRTRSIWGDAATKEALTNIFSSGQQSAALLFTASHGMCFPQGDARQKPAQGALLCQGWPGPGSITADHYFAAADLPAASRVHGLVAFHFACYGAGTPATDRYFHSKDEPPPTIAPEAFIAALPKALLTHPHGGALACIGHVERAWGYSIGTSRAGNQLLPFQNALSRILAGQPVGYALKDFYERYAALSTTLTSKLEDLSFGKHIPDEELASDWVERNDAEGYVLLGDPGARLRVQDLA